MLCRARRWPWRSMLALSTVGCAKVGELKAKKAFKDGQRRRTSSRTTRRPPSSTRRRSTADPNLNQAYFFLGNSYDNLYKPSKKGEPANDALLDQGGRRTTRRPPRSSRRRHDRPTRSSASCRSKYLVAVLRRRQAERPGQGRTGRPADDSARAGRADELLRARQDLRGRRRLRRSRADAAARPRRPSRTIRRST